MRANKFWKKIQNTQDEEILCGDCLDQVSAYVDLELDGKPADTIMPQLKHHLEQCQVCQDEYELLRDFAKLERERNMPPIEVLKAQIRAAKSSRASPDGSQSGDQIRCPR